MSGQSSGMTSGADPLDQAISAVRRGDMAQARTIAETAIDGGTGDTAALHGLMGMVCARSGDLAAATQHLAKAHALRPQDITIACNLIALLMDQKRDEDALKVASADLMNADTSLRIARYRAFLAQKLEDFGAATGAYERVIQKHPDDFECWNNLGNARAGFGDHAGAVDALRRAIKIDPGAAPARLNLAAALQSLDLLQEAEDELVRAIADFPGDPRLPYELYVLRKKQMRQEDALAALLQTSQCDPQDADIQLKLGIEYGVLRRTDEAEAAYRQAIRLDPADFDAYLGLAIQYEHTNREDEFTPLIELARQNGIADNKLAFIEALELRRARKFEHSLARLDNIPEDLEPVRTAHIRATLLDRLRRADDAFSAFVHVNEMMQDSPTRPLERASELRAKLAEELAMLTPRWRNTLPAIAIDDDRPDPVFLLGFPRSGTTLLDTILMGHAETAVMEEQPPLNTVEEELGGLQALPDLDAREIARARDHYFAEVAKIQPLATGQLLIDKSPLFLYRLPLICRLFPNAKIILALRHPCDVVLSCFMSNFRLNSAMSNFLRLEDAAAFYDLCFRHWRQSRALFPADIHTFTYECLVEDAEKELRPLINWLGIDWSDTLLDHSATARSRGLIATASYSQVTEPIYRRASGRWKRYAHHLAPVLPVLEPWIRQFGYWAHDSSDPSSVSNTAW
ncbi:MAG: sulfotransferase [Alteraurantiacibacter sp. bin_em_oilr2.035]|nr:sulfotransferase [Alteraurantiacibacter sp. bin_em_oilr2.035]